MKWGARAKSLPILCLSQSLQIMRLDTARATVLSKTVISRTDADIRTLRLLRVMLICPKCESDRVIPLTFPPDLGEITVGMPDRPVAKCADCGHELSAGEVTAQEEPSG